MDNSKDLVLEDKVVENALNELINRWASASFDVQTVIDGFLSTSIQLTFKMCSSHENAVEMVAEHVTNAMINNHQSAEFKETDDDEIQLQLDEDNHHANKGEFQVEEGIAHQKFNSPFCIALNKLDIGQSIGNLTKEQTYKYRPNFYSKHFADRKFSFSLEENGYYRIWRIK
tara:strand:+ start:86 stop:601 length:516 start_codon:yes stop_codon:yes gene_type:complete